MFNKIKDASKGLSEKTKSVSGGISERVKARSSTLYEQAKSKTKGMPRIGESSSEIFSRRIEGAKSSLDEFRDVTSRSFGSGKQKVSQSFEKSWPAIEKLIAEGLLGVAEEKLRDEQFLSSVFEKAYEILPAGVRLVLKRDTFIDHCMKRREPIIGRLERFKESRQLEIEADENLKSDVSKEALICDSNDSNA